MIIYTRNIYTARGLRKAWNLSHFEDIRIALSAENGRENIAKDCGSNLTDDATFLIAHYRNNNYAILDINTVGFLVKLMKDK